MQNDTTRPVQPCLGHSLVPIYATATISLSYYNPHRRAFSPSRPTPFFTQQ